MAGIQELLCTTLCLGVQHDEQWKPAGCGFLMTDGGMVWLVTSTRVLERAGAGVSAWVSRKEAGVLLGLGAIMHATGLEWVRHEEHGLALTAFPLHPDWNVKALPCTQTVPRGALQPLMGVHALAFPYGIEGFDPRDSLPLILSGSVIGQDPRRERIYTDVAPLPLCEGTPLLVGSGSGGQLQLVLAGVMQGGLRTQAQVPADSLPLGLAALSWATPIHGVIELFNGDAVEAQREAARKASPRAQA